jgi:hypothetical protein
LTPEIFVGFEMTIDWKGYSLRTDKGIYRFPGTIHILPWQYPLLRRIIPNLAVIQITAYPENRPPLAWTIFYPVNM